MERNKEKKNVRYKHKNNLIKLINKKSMEIIS
jgi:hypothetical protein